MITLLSEVSIILVRAVCELLLASYGSKHTMFRYDILCVLTLITQSTDCTQTFYISNDCSTLGDVYFLLEWNVRYEWQLRLQTHIAVSFRSAIFADAAYVDT